MKKSYRRKENMVSKMLIDFMNINKKKAKLNICEIGKVSKTGEKTGTRNKLITAVDECSNTKKTLKYF